MYFYWGLQKENGNIPKFHTGYGKIDLKSRENILKKIDILNMRVLQHS